MLSFGRYAGLILLVALLLPATAGADTAGYAVTADWRKVEVTWADMASLPRNSEFTAPLAACYNLGYGATVLGLNLRSGDEGSQYYVAIASCVNDQLTVYDSLGPYTAPAQWDSGPYHVAAGLPDGQLAVWLTAPNEYPRRSVIALDYRPGTTFTTAVLPPAGLSNHWRAWQIDAAYLAEDLALAVGTYDGLGRFSGGPELLDTRYGLSWIGLRQVALTEYWTPSVVYTNRNGVYHAWHDQLQGWQRDWLANSQVDNVRLWVSPEPSPPRGLVLYVDGSDAYAQPKLHALTISNAGGLYVTARWGNATTLPAVYNQPLTAFIDTVDSVWPLITQAADGDIHLAYNLPDPTGKDPLPFASVLLHFGDRTGAGTSTIEAHPITGITGTAHWQTGDPEIFWVQLGGGSAASAGTLFRLSYEPEEAD